MNEWKPIETGPKDGTYVLLFYPTYKLHVRIGNYEKREEFVNGKLKYSKEHWKCDVMSMPGCDPQPTHWMPLPEPPEKENAP